MKDDPLHRGLLKLKRALVRLRLKRFRDRGLADQNSAALFIWIPKTAGTSLNDALSSAGCREFKSLERARYGFHPGGFATFDHLSVAALVEAGVVPLSWLRSAKRFTFVRHPVSRCISLYRYLKEKNVIPESDSFSTFLARLPEDFEKSGPEPDLRSVERQWLAYEGDLLDRFDNACPSPGLYNSLALSQCRPQVEWLRCPDGVEPSGNGFGLAQFIGRFESLEADLARLAQYLEVPELKLPHRNPSTTKRPEITVEECKRIEKLYRRDFEAFGY